MCTAAGPSDPVVGRPKRAFKGDLPGETAHELRLAAPAEPPRPTPGRGDPPGLPYLLLNCFTVPARLARGICGFSADRVMANPPQTPSKSDRGARASCRETCAPNRNRREASGAR